MSKPAPKPKPKTKLSAADKRFLADYQAKLRGLRKVQAEALKQATTSKRNRILKRAEPDEVMGAMDRVRAKVRARKDQFDGAVKKARVTKRDRAKTLVFDTKGKRYKDLQSVPGRIKVYMLRVGPRGGRRLINPDDPNTIMRGVKAQPIPLSRRDFRFDKLVKIAPKKFREVMAEAEQESRKRQGYKVMTKEDLQAEVEHTAPVDVGRNGDIEAFYEKAAQAYVGKVRSYQDLTNWGFDMLVSVQGQERVLRMTSQQLPSHNFFKVIPEGRTGRKIVFRNNSTSAKALRMSIRFLANELIRAELRVRGLVSQGSASQISRLPHNKGLAKSKWRDKNGSRWRGAGLQTARIRRIQFRLFRIV